MDSANKEVPSHPLRTSFLFLTLRSQGFNAVYNAIEGFSTTYVMPDFHFSALKGRDVVMAETLLRRNVEVDGTWDNHFQLSTLSVLALSPRD